MTATRAAPPFDTYYPTPDGMEGAQRSFYDWLRREFNCGRHPSVDGQISYLSAYVYAQLAQAPSRGYSWVHERLVEIAEDWEKTRFSVYCTANVAGIPKGLETSL